MKRWLIVLLGLVAVQAEGMVPLPQMRVPLKTDVKVKSSRARRTKDSYTGYGARAAVQRDTSQSVFLSIEVRNMSPKVMKDIRISYQFYELQFEQSTQTRLVFTRRMGNTEKLVQSGRGQLTIAELKPLEKKVVETETLETSYRSTQDMTKFVPRTNTAGRKFGGYIVEYYVGGQLARRDASSRRLHELYLRSIRQPGTSVPVRMRIER